MNRTIEVTEEQYDFLIELSKRLDTQDNRITADPIFCVYQKSTVLKAPGRGNSSGWLDDEGHITSDEDIKKSGEVEGWREQNPEDAELDEELILIDRLGYEKVEFSEEDVPVGGQVYFTEAAAKAHIAANNYHYNKPFVYVDSAWRNPEIQMLRKILLELTTK